MPYVLNGTRTLLNYWNTLGRPCEIKDLAATTGIPRINFMGTGRDRVSETYKYGEVQAQALAGLLGVSVSDVTDNGGQILI